MSKNAQVALYATLDKFTAAKTAMLTAIDDNTFLTKSSKKKMSKYLHSFYKSLDDKEALRTIFIENTNDIAIVNLPMGQE